MVLQDDVLPCDDAGRRIAEAAGERPDDIVSLFVGGLTNRTRGDYYKAMKAGQRWSPIYFRDIHHVVALVWPVAEAKAFVEFVATAKLPGPTVQKSDDAAVGYWVRKHFANRDTRKIVWATVPCLVEHPDDVPSTVHAIGRQGDRGRKAIWFTG